MNNKKQTAEKWYKTLEFNKDYDKAFYDALDEKDIFCDSVSDYDINSSDGLSNLIHFLYFCEFLKNEYEKRGIGEDILIDTLKDIPRWTDTYTNMKGSLFLGELGWLRNHLTLRLFKLGRLQFCLEDAPENYPDTGVVKGEKIVGIHIPSTGPLNIDECRKSIEYAREFMSNFFPEYQYKIFNCHSWLLDETLEKFMKKESNILKFQTLFNIVSSSPSDAILKYIFTWDTTRENLTERQAKSSFANAVREHILSGGTLRESTGIIKK
ncbi:MAG: DUF5596 domain-containing protein [Clostridia bacterium]|nr:DUF5596 domain-containing protein [Clostridia bacterium]